ncbi:RIP metalloprotease RseP [Baaleninema sp.]|uniref:RIP metalloprotease RseP n=1 Tax=Baaleninema sp. TaxID=3101197 RepID=UPI003D0774AC
MSVLAAIAVLALLIVVHELGHFLAARWQGIHVNRFSIGFGPILLKYQGAETEYAVRAFPLGGFVGFPDDDPESTIPDDDPDLLRNRPVLDRAIVISAGVIANLIFAYLVLAVQIGSTGVPVDFKPEPGVEIPQVISVESPAGRAGIEAGDVILSIDGQSLEAGEDAIWTLKETIEDNANQSLSLVVQRGDRQLSLTVVPEAGNDGNGRIGVQLAPNGDPVYRQADGIGEVLTLSAERFQSIFVMTLQGFYRLISNFSETAGQLAGPVGIVAQGADAAQRDAVNLLVFAAVVSINLAIINILPLPALDGGQLAFLLVEGLRGKPVPVHIQDGVMQSGLLFLLGLGIFLIVRDTTQLEWVQQLTR